MIFLKIFVLLWLKESGVAFIRRRRGKAALSQSSEAHENNEDLRGLIRELTKRVTNIEKELPRRQPE